jgi:hypothetical protein
MLRDAAQYIIGPGLRFTAHSGEGDQRCPARGDHVIRSMTTRAAQELDGAFGCVF